MKMFNLRRGVGLYSLLISILLLIGAFLLKNIIPLPDILSNPLMPRTIFSLSVFIMLIVFIWSKKTLPRKTRANALCTSGPYKYVRHPIYLAIVANLNFGIAIFLNNYIFLIWAIAVYIIWFKLVDYEEQYLIRVFHNEYYLYQKRTGKFLPKLSYLLLNNKKKYGGEGGIRTHVPRY